MSITGKVVFNSLYDYIMTKEVPFTHLFRSNTSSYYGTSSTENIISQNTHNDKPRLLLLKNEKDKDIYGWELKTMHSQYDEKYHLFRTSGGTIYIALMTNIHWYPVGYVNIPTMCIGSAEGYSLVQKEILDKIERDKQKRRSTLDDVVNRKMEAIEQNITDIFEQFDSHEYFANKGDKELAAMKLSTLISKACATLIDNSIKTKSKGFLSSLKVSLPWQSKK